MRFPLDTRVEITSGHYAGEVGSVAAHFQDSPYREYDVRLDKDGGLNGFHEHELKALALTDTGPLIAPAMLGFESGATRNRKENELQYEGFISPLALQMFAEYMHENRHTADGGVRASDNWQKGIPDESYRDSLLRHVIDIWMIYRGWDGKARDGGDKRKALAGAFFNLQGLMHNLALEELQGD